ncbi:hypothetical protein AAFF_G00409660 [Aldrovandia affinis]|uniref:Uncharacterized protein n=1 Tax=Aldrovandia affinis TaxID=143900 RepID=A0AAD7WK17_9TELE|nr:hypothetical protein AAFF_G00409660 [Aldrovandia affinis]
MEFELGRFLDDPTIEQFDSCRKADLLLIADHFKIEVLRSDTKLVIKTKVTAGLLEQKVLSEDAVPRVSSVKVGSPNATLQARQFELELKRLALREKELDAQVRLKELEVEAMRPQLLHQPVIFAVLPAGLQNSVDPHTDLRRLQRKERSHLRDLEKESSQSEPEPDIFPLVLSELVNYIVETSLSSDAPAIFHLADMSNLYQQRLEQLGVNSPTVNSTRLKEKLLAEIPELEAHKQGRYVLLAFQVDVGLALSQASKYSEALIMAKAAKILRRHILDHQSRFDGTFCEECIKDAIPPILLQFIGMVEHGADIKSQLRFDTSRTD